MKKLVKVVVPVILLAGGFWAYGALGSAKQAPEKKEETQRLITLFVDEVTADEVVLSVNAQGEVRPKTEIDLIAQVSGQVMSVSNGFAEGASFEPGQKLVQIDDSDYKLAVIRAEARVAEAEVRVQTEEAAAAIKEQQWREHGKPGKPVPLAVNGPQVAEAKAKLKSAQADLAAARLDLERTQIKLPFNGRVREKSIGIGQYVSAGTKLGRVFATDVVEIRLPMTDRQLAELGLPIGFEATEGNAPEVWLKAEVGGEEQVWPGKIVRTDAAINEQTRLISAIAEVANPYTNLSAEGVPLAVGLFVTAEIEGVESQSAFVMPRVALRNDDKVYVVNDEDKLEIRTVDVLSTNEERALVTAGVNVGDRVVTSTLPNAADGMAVRALVRGEEPVEEEAEPVELAQNTL